MKEIMEQHYLNNISNNERFNINKNPSYLASVG